MTTPEGGVFALLKPYALWSLGVVGAGVAWFLKRTISRLDDVESALVPRNELNDTIERAVQAMDQHATRVEKTVTREVDRLHKRLDRVEDRVIGRSE